MGNTSIEILYISPKASKETLKTTLDTAKEWSKDLRIIMRYLNARN